MREASATMKIVCKVLLLMVICSSAALADEVISNAQARQLLAIYSCQTCHSLDSSSLPGPSLRQIAKKYASDPEAIGDLEASVLNGSSGTWGNNQMPSTDVSAKDLKAIIVWILQLM
jgi:cytochrome c